MESFVLHSTASAPCPAEGVISERLKKLDILFFSPNLFKPAAASIIPSYSPLSNLCILVSTLPRILFIEILLDIDSSCFFLLTEDVPKTFKSWMFFFLEFLFKTSTSIGFSLLVTVNEINLSSDSVGKSFKL